MKIEQRGEFWAVVEEESGRVVCLCAQRQGAEEIAELLESKKKLDKFQKEQFEQNEDPNSKD